MIAKNIEFNYVVVKNGMKARVDQVYGEKVDKNIKYDHSNHLLKFQHDN